MNEMYYEGQDIGKRIFYPEHSAIVSVLSITNFLVTTSALLR